MAREERELFGPVLRRVRAPDFGPAIKRGAAVHVPEWRLPSGRALGEGGGTATVDFSRASPISAERRQSDYARIQHIDITHVTRTVVPVSSDGKTHQRYPAVTGVAADHHGYVISGALSRAKHYDYITRQAGGRDPHDPTPVMDVLDFEELHREENVLAIYSNIGVTAERQRSLFEAAERCERQAHGGTLTVSTKHAAAWRDAAVQSDALEWVRDASKLLDAIEVKQVLAAARKRKPVVEQIVTVTKVNLAQAYDRLVEADAVFGKRSPALPDFVQGRSGRVQTRFVVELPRNLDAQSYHEIMRRYCDYLAADGWMFVAAIHRPDPHNTQANIHLHIDAYDRPSRWLDAHSCWDFEYCVRKRNGDWSYPFRQNKIAIARGKAGGPSGREVASAYYKRLRAAFAQIANEIVDGRPDNPTYVAGTYRQNNINLTPLAHLGNRVIANEKRGVVTPAGHRNALVMFGDRLRQVRADLAAARRDLHRRARARIAAARTAAAQRMVRDWRRHEATALHREAQAGVLGVAEALLRSRAEAVIAHQRGDDQPPAKRRLEQAAVADAQTWITEIDALMPQNAEQEAEATIVANHRDAARAALAKADDFDRNALPDFAYRARFSHGVAVRDGHRDETRGRLLRWLDGHERDEKALIFDGEEIAIGAAVQKSIDRLFRLFVADRVVQERLHRERQRREWQAIVDDPGVAELHDTVAPAVEIESSFGSKPPTPAAPEALEPKRDVPAPLAKGIMAQAQRLTKGLEPVGSKRPEAPRLATSRRDVPDHRADPVRVAEITELIRDLERFGHLPLVPQPADANGAPRFSIDLDLGDPLDRRLAAFRAAARFEDDPAIQALYFRQHQHTVRTAGFALNGIAVRQRDAVRQGVFDELEPTGSGLAHSLTLLRGTPALVDLLRQAEAHWARSDGGLAGGSPTRPVKPLAGPANVQSDPGRQVDMDEDQIGKPGGRGDGVGR